MNVNLPNENENTPEIFVQKIINWFKAVQYPQTLIDAIIVETPEEEILKYIHATPETIARILTIEYAERHSLSYHIESKINHHYLDPSKNHAV